MIKLVSDIIDKEDIKALTEWLNQTPTPQLTKGPLTKELEKKWSEYLGVKHTVYVNSGSSAILLMLASLKAGKKLKNNRIVVPGLSWVTDVSSCMQLGFEPVLCDCNLQDLSVSLEKLENCFRANRPSAFILVHVVGLVPDMEKIIELCDKYKVILLEDVCESTGSRYQGQLLGTFGYMSVFSLYYGHHLSTIEGGFICTNDSKINSLNLMLRNHGWDRDLSLEEQTSLREKHNIDDFNSQYTFYYPGFNLRSTDFQAFIGLRQIDKLPHIIECRAANFEYYKQYIKSNILELKSRIGDTTSNFAYPVAHLKKNEIVKELKKASIEVRPLIAGSMAKQPFWLKEYYPQHLPNCDLIHEYGFYLPNHPELTCDTIHFIANVINKYE